MNEEDKLGMEIIGDSPKLNNVIKAAKKISQNSAITTLITGESGTGKEIFARLIHNVSATGNQPFVDINCSAIPESLLESELFGYEKGAFTGATMRKQGLFELANGGTIFLDEIGDVTLNFQTKLLKAVENKRFRRISGVEEINISTRIIAATNVNLREAVEAGRFREDLYYRLNVCQIQLPALRERDDDAIILANHFVEHFNREYDRQVQGLGESAKSLIREYSWPGNIRQLKNAIERAILVECDDWIEAEHFRLDSEREKKRDVAIKLEPEPKENGKQTFDFTKIEIPSGGIALEDVERNLLLSALEKANGNISKAARLLQINRGKFRYRLERLDIDLQNFTNFTRAS